MNAIVWKTTKGLRVNAFRDGEDVTIEVHGPEAWATITLGRQHQQELAAFLTADQP